MSAKHFTDEVFVKLKSCSVVYFLEYLFLSQQCLVHFYPFIPSPPSLSLFLCLSPPSPSPSSSLSPSLSVTLSLQLSLPLCLSDVCSVTLLLGHTCDGSQSDIKTDHNNPRLRRASSHTHQGHITSHSPDMHLSIIRHTHAHTHTQCSCESSCSQTVYY